MLGRKKYLILLVIFLMCAAFSFAGGQKDQASQKTTLRFSWWGGEDRHNGTLAAIDLYEKTHPGITIEAEYSGWDGYYQKLVTQIAGGTAPDIMQMSSEWLEDISGKGDLLVNLGDRSDLDLSGFDEKFISTYCSIDGNILGVPTGIGGELLIFYKPVLKSAGIPLDTEFTWESIVDLGAKVHNQSSDRYMINASTSDLAYLLQKYIIQLSGGYIDGKNKKVLFSVNDATKAFEYFQTWFDNNIVQPLAVSTLFDGDPVENPDWINGNFGGLREWTSGINKVANGRPADDFILASIPVLDGAEDSGIKVYPSQVIVVNSKSNNIDAAIDFVNYFFNDEDAIIATQTIRGVPASSIARNILKENGLLDPMVEKATSVSMASMGKPFCSLQNNSEIKSILKDVIEEFGYGKLTAKKAAETLILRLESKLSEL